MPRKKIVYNEDGDLIACLQPGRAAHQMRHYLDWTMDRIPIDIYEFHCATPDVCYFGSKTGEVIGRRMMDEVMAYTRENPYVPGTVGKPVKLHYHISRGLQLLLDEDVDPLDLHIEQCHRRGVRLLPEMRMGDTHQRDLDPSNPLVAQFARDHPQYLIPRTDRITSVALDYTFPEVREHRLAILREMAEEHEVDGLCLNFMRWGKYFERDKGREKAPIMTEFVGQVRAMLDQAAAKRGCDRLLLGVRVLSTVEESLGAGLDTGAWMQRGYVDYLTVCEHNCSWPALKVEPFVAAAQGTGCEIYGQMGDMIGGTWGGPPEPIDREYSRLSDWSGYTSMLNTPDEARAIAGNLYTWGAQGIGFWNIPNDFNPFNHGKAGRFPEHQQRILEWMLATIDSDQVRAGTRRYHYVPLYKRDYTGLRRNYKYIESQRSPHGKFTGKTIYFNEGMRDVRQTYPFRMADGCNGEKLTGKMSFWVFHVESDDDFGVDINGATIDASKTNFESAETTRSGLPGKRYEIDLAECPPFAGDNELGLTWRSDRRLGPNVPFMEELDIIVEP